MSWRLKMNKTWSTGFRGVNRVEWNLVHASGVVKSHRVLVVEDCGCARRVSMPPSPAFGWLCVAHSIADIALRAAQIRSVQALPKSPGQASEKRAPARVQKTRTSFATEKVDAVEISASEGSAIHEESSSPRQLNVITDNNLSGAAESNVSSIRFTVQGRTSVSNTVNVVRY